MTKPALQFAELPKTTIWITRDWVHRGLRAREAWVSSGTAVTDEDRGDGVKWTPYSIGFDAHLTREEAIAKVEETYHREIAEHCRAINVLGEARDKCRETEQERLQRLADRAGDADDGDCYVSAQRPPGLAPGQQRNWVAPAAKVSFGGGGGGGGGEPVDVATGVKMTIEAKEIKVANHYPVKQVILMRSDLKNTQGQKVRSGKLMVQAAHAAMIWLSKRLAVIWSPGGYDRMENYFSDDEVVWLEGSFAKIVLEVKSEAELLDLVEKARAAGLQAEVCVDNGTTEFGGVPTNTCAAIGPAAVEKIDAVTGHLRPL